MPFLSRPCGAKIFYETKGRGIPVLLLAPGGMRSSLAKFQTHPYNPWSSLPESSFFLIGMDQRFANRSTGLPADGDGWHTFMADQLALLDHLGVQKCHMLGSCIGPSYMFQLLRDHPTRFGRCVMLQPIGLAEHTTEPASSWQGLNKHATWQWAGDWANEMVQTGKCTNLDLMKDLHDRMFGDPRDFVFSISRQEAAQIGNKLLIFMGRDIYHPAETARIISRICPKTELVEKWRDEEPERMVEASKKIQSFLLEDPL